LTQAWTSEEMTMRGETESLRTQLDLRQKELRLTLAIDHIRDTASDPTTMLSTIVDTLADQFQADVCLICLLDRETGELALKAINDRSQSFGGMRITPELAQWVARSDGVTIWDREQVQTALGLPHLPDTLQLAAVPIIMGDDQHLGALLLARSRSPFDQTDLALLRTTESQIDSAVIQGYAHHDLQLRNQELETIYRIDRIRDLHLPFDQMLNSVLQELRTVIQAEMGFVMLYNRMGQQLELRAATPDNLFRVSPHYQMVEQVANQALQRTQLVCHNEVGGALRSIMCIPLILQEEIIGVLGVVNRYGPGGFSAEDRRLLSAIGSQMDTAIFESLERRRLRRVLGRAVDPRVMERLLRDPDVAILKGERAVISVLYSDLRGSTSLAEHTDPELFVGFINDYLSRMTEVILSHEGTLDKFVGDEVMALFSAPIPQPDHALRAVRVGLEMQKAHQSVMESWRGCGLDPAPAGIGIATGELIVGEIGSSQRSDYTVIGRVANLGARICSEAGAGQVLVCQTTYDMIQEGVEATPVPGLRLKGVDHSVTAYHITRLL
jgi:adenylate cyclase